MRVLMVEDEVQLGASVQRGLAAEGITVEVVDDGLDGLWRAREAEYEVIILDVMLPGMNGFELCRTLRSEEVHTPILFLTAKDGEYDEAEGLDLGADDYLRKPFSLVVLVARLRALARRGPVERATTMSAGPFELDPGTRRCRREGTEVELTQREYAVLEYLIRRAPDVVSKSDLLDAVWGIDFDGDPNIVEVYIGRLRRAIDTPFDRRSIETVRGAGYRLDPDGG